MSFETNFSINDLLNDVFGIDPVELLDTENSQEDNKETKETNNQDIKANLEDLKKSFNSFSNLAENFGKEDHFENKDFEFEVEIKDKENVDVKVRRIFDNQLPHEEPFSAHLGKNRKVFIRLEDYEYDKDFSDLGNAKRIVKDYLEEHTDLLDILEAVDDSDSDVFSASVDTADEVVDTMINLENHTSITPVIEFPAKLTFEVLTRLKKEDISPELFSAGNKNVLTFY